MNLEVAEVQFQNGIQFQASGQLDIAIDSYQKALAFQPENAEIHKKLGEVYVLLGQYQHAINACETALKFQPQFPAAYLTLGNAYQGEGNLEDAIWAYLQALQLQPNFAEAHANLGSMYYRQGYLSEATLEYKKALELNPNLTSIYILLGNIFSQNQQFDQALSMYQKALETEPNQGKIHFKIGLTLARQNQREAARQSYQKALELEPHNAQAYQELAHLIEASPAPVTTDSQEEEEEYSLQPDALNLESPEKAANLNLQQQTYSFTSTEELTTFNFQVPQHLTVFQDVEGYKRQADTYLAQGNYAEAIACCKQALKIRPNFVPVYITFGNALQGQGKTDEAIRAYSQALEFQPTFAEIHANIGSMYFKQRKFDEALKCYQAALIYKPELAGVHWNIGKVYQQQGNMAEATEAWKKAAALQPNLVGADFHFNLGHTLFNQGKADEAVASYERAIAINPNWAEALANVGSVKTRQGKLEEATDYYRRAIAIKPELVGLHYNLGNVCLQRGKYEEAITNYQEALKLKSDWAEAYANMASAQSMLGRLEESVVNFENALKYKPDWAEVYCRMGHIQKQDNPHKAIENFEKSIQLKPEYSEAHQQLCDLLSHSSNLARARQVADRYVQHCGEVAPIMSAVAYVFSYLQSGVSQKALAKMEEVEKLCHETQCQKFSRIELKLLYEIFLFTVSHLRDDQKRNADFYRVVAKEYYNTGVKPNPPDQSLLPASYWANPRQKQLRIGFLSKHFRRHSVGWCSEALIRELTHITPHVHLYVTGKLKQDEVTKRFEAMAGKFYWPKSYPNGFASSAEILGEVRRDQLDVLIDLDSMTVPVNVEVLQHDPAFVCGSWLGFDAPYMSEKHYFFCDWFTHPEGVEQYYMEKLIRLSQGSVAIGNLEFRAIDRNGVRQSMGIRPDQMVYLCVAPGRKTNPGLVSAQIRILKEVPDSMLIRKGQGDPQMIRQTYTEECVAQGVDVNRVKFLGQTKTEEEHRSIYRLADVLLDSYPYSGGTHNLEALSADLPVVTRMGDQYLSRMGYAFLKSVNLDVGIARNWDEYTQWGIKYGRDANFRNSIRQHLIQSKKPESLAPLWNPGKLAREMYDIFHDLLAKAVS